MRRQCPPSCSTTSWPSLMRSTHREKPGCSAMPTPPGRRRSRGCGCCCFRGSKPSSDGRLSTLRSMRCMRRYSTPWSEPPPRDTVSESGSRCSGELAVERHRVRRVERAEHRCRKQGDDGRSDDERQRQLGHERLEGLLWGDKKGGGRTDGADEPAAAEDDQAVADGAQEIVSDEPDASGKCLANGGVVEHDLVTVKLDEHHRAE